MDAILIAHTPNPEKVVAAAAKLCYSASDPGKLFEGLTDEAAAAFLQRLTDLGHASPTEHASFTFAIWDVSRALLAQITRHRMASFSVRSQRYVNMSDAVTFLPDDVADDAESAAIYMDAVEVAHDAYDALLGKLTFNYMTKQGMSERDATKKAQENARYLLPEGTSTALIVTMNARSLNNFFRLRCCNRAQDEIRALADKMLSLVYPVAPHLFASAGPACVSGPCPEGAMCCGKADAKRSHIQHIKEVV